MKAYKVFNSDWTCNNYQYEVGKIYDMIELPILCSRGFHACRNAVDCFDYYAFAPDNKVAEVELVGDIVGIDGDKQATNKIKIVKEIKWADLLELVNIGKGNTGKMNSGYSNSGDRNSGYRNSGDRNSGYRNSGHSNSGYRNSGDRNSGDWNTKPPKKIMFFNKMIKYSSLLKVRNGKAYSILYRFRPIKYRIKTSTGKNGDYKYLPFKSSFKYFWRNLTINERRTIIDMNHFDKKIFYEITGVKVK